MMGNTRGEKAADRLRGTAVFKARQIRFVVLMAAVAIGSAAFLFPKLGTTLLHVDESGWISSGRYYTNLVWDADLSRDKWTCRECGGFGNLNMPLGKWLIGIPLAFDRQSREEAFFRFYDNKASYDENLERGLIPPPHTLMIARSASAVFGVLCCLLAFTIGWYAGNAIIGIAAAVFVVLDPLFIRQATRAMTDIHYNFFLLCFCLAVVLLSAASSPNRALFLAALCGIFAGLACSIKVTGLVIGSISFLVVAGRRLWFGLTTRKAFVYHLGVFCCSALLVIYGLNPYFWPSPRRLWDTAVFREVKDLSNEIVSARGLPPDIKDRYPHIGTLGWPLQFPRMFQRWNSVMQRQEEIPSAKWDRPRLIEITRRVFVEFKPFRSEFLFLGFGMVVLLVKRLRRMLSIPDNPALTCLQYFLVNYLFLLAVLRVNWDRYYLPAVLAGSLVAAFGVYAVASYIYQLYPMLTRAAFADRNRQP